MHDRDREKKDTTKKGTSIMCSNTTKPCTYKTITQPTQVAIERIRACKPWTDRETHTHKVEDEGEEGTTHGTTFVEHNTGDAPKKATKQQQIPITNKDTPPSHVVLITYNDRKRVKERRERWGEREKEEDHEKIPSSKDYNSISKDGIE